MLNLWKLGQSRLERTRRMLEERDEFAKAVVAAMEQDGLPVPRGLFTEEPMPNISSGIIAIPRYVESLRGLYGGNFTCNSLNGKLAHFVAPGSSGMIVGDFSRPTGVPRGCMGGIGLWDGLVAPIFKIDTASMQFELGPKDGDWSVIDHYAAAGLDSVSSRVFAFRGIGADPGNERSLLVEFGVIDDALDLLASLDALKAWAAQYRPLPSTVA